VEQRQLLHQWDGRRFIGSRYLSGSLTRSSPSVYSFGQSTRNFDIYRSIDIAIVYGTAK
jgi:hypothetical protein